MVVVWLCIVMNDYQGRKHGFCSRDSAITVFLIFTYVMLMYDRLVYGNIDNNNEKNELSFFSCTLYIFYSLIIYNGCS